MTKAFENAIAKTELGKVIPSSYDMSLEDTTELYKLCATGGSNAIIAAIMTAFRFGFVMGNRATHSRKLQRL